MPFRRFPEQSPVPVSAVIDGSAVSVTFDQELQPGSLDAANWSVWHDGSLFAVDDAVASGFSVALTLGFGTTDPGTPGVSYAASPADVIGVNGLPAEAFSDFPFE